MYQPHPSAGQPAGPERPPAPAPVRTAIRLMYAGAAISAVPLIAALAYAGDIKAYHLHWGNRSLTAAQISHWRPLIITVVILAGLVVPALWLWVAWAAGQGRNWARIASTVLFGLATLLADLARGPGGRRAEGPARQRPRREERPGAGQDRPVNRTTGRGSSGQRTDGSPGGYGRGP